MIGKVVYNILYNDASVQAVVGTRIYPGQANEGAVYPHLVYHLVSNAPGDHKDSGTEFDRKRVQVDCLTEDYDDCEDLADKVRTALDRAKDEQTTEGVLVKTILYQGEVDLNEYAASVGADSEVFHRAVDFIIITG